jgi:hypothetical protein
MPSLTGAFGNGHSRFAHSFGQGLRPSGIGQYPKATTKFSFKFSDCATSKGDFPFHALDNQSGRNDHTRILQSSNPRIYGFKVADISPAGLLAPSQLKSTAIAERQQPQIDTRSDAVGGTHQFTAFPAATS